MKLILSIELQMPRLTAESGSGNLTWALSNLGLTDLFKPGFSQLYDVSDYKWLSVSDILHKTYLDIRESTVFPQPVTVATTTTTTTSPPQVNRVPSAEREGVVNPFFTGVQFKLQPPTVLPQKVQAVQQPDREVVNVVFDKPFIYFVIDNISGLIMVMGKFGREPVSYRLPV